MAKERYDGYEYEYEYEYEDSNENLLAKWKEIDDPTNSLTDLIKEKRDIERLEREEEELKERKRVEFQIKKLNLEYANLLNNPTFLKGIKRAVADHDGYLKFDPNSRLFIFLDREKFMDFTGFDKLPEMQSAVTKYNELGIEIIFGETDIFKIKGAKETKEPIKQEEFILRYFTDDEMNDIKDDFTANLSKHYKFPDYCKKRIAETFETTKANMQIKGLDWEMIDKSTMTMEEIFEIRDKEMDRRVNIVKGDVGREMAELLNDPVFNRALKRALVDKMACVNIKDLIGTLSKEIGKDYLEEPEMKQAIRDLEEREIEIDFSGDTYIFRAKGDESSCSQMDTATFVSKYCTREEALHLYKHTSLAKYRILLYGV